MRGNLVNSRAYCQTATAPRNDVLPVKLVVATALMAICRKVIVFDFKELTPMYIIATAAVVLALGIIHWLISKKQ